MENTIYSEPRFRAVGDRGLLVEYGDSIDPALNRKVRTVAQLCRTDPPPGLIEVVPAYRSLQLIYDPLHSDPPSLEGHLRSLEGRLDSISPPPARTVTIPVCYGHEFGPDLSVVAEHNALSQEETVRLHSQAEYLIYMLGFTPGFPFLGGLDKRLHTPRRETPRTTVPEGSVGIANGQTGIYPLSSPGGWQLIGRTPLRLFDMEIRLNSKTIPAWSSFRVEPGDLLRLKQVKSGCRAYLGVSGGFDVPLVMGSRSTCVTGGFGGIQGRSLRKGDFLPAVGGSLLSSEQALPSELIPAAKKDDLLLRVVAGPQNHLFSQGLEPFLGSPSRISARADRMGYRLEGPVVERDTEAEESIISEPSLPGNIQIPADGQPIILLVEQTVGGYTKIATVISPDLSRLAQALPGQTVRFQPVSLEEARLAYQENENHIQRLRETLTGPHN